MSYQKKFPEIFESTVPNTERQLENAGSTKTNAGYSRPLPLSNGAELTTVSGEVAAVFDFNQELASFISSDNYEYDEKSKSGDYKVIYYSSNEKSIELLSVDSNVINLPESDPKYKNFIKNLGNNVGGGRVVVDASKIEVLPQRGDKVSLQIVKADHTYPASLISVEKSTSQPINGAPDSNPKLKKETKKEPPVKNSSGTNASGNAGNNNSLPPEKVLERADDSESKNYDLKVRAPRDLEWLKQKDVKLKNLPNAFGSNSEIDEILWLAITSIRQEAITLGIIKPQENFLKPGNGYRTKETRMKNAKNKKQQIKNALTKSGIYKVGAEGEERTLKKLSNGNFEINAFGKTKTYPSSKEDEAITTMGGYEVAMGASTHESGLASDVYLGPSPEFYVEEKKVIKYIKNQGKKMFDFFIKSLPKYGLVKPLSNEPWHIELPLKNRDILEKKLKAPSNT